MLYCEVVMCLDDTKIGRRRWSRSTIVVLGSPVTIPADKRRVAFRVVGVVANTNFICTDPATGAVFMRGTSTSNPNDEIWVERHGSLVMGDILVTPAGGNVTATEVFQEFFDKIPEDT